VQQDTKTVHAWVHGLSRRFVDAAGKIQDELIHHGGTRRAFHRIPVRALYKWSNSQSVNLEYSVAMPPCQTLLVYR
jgi:hypothetical protein